jgi:hypothetical protein
MGYHGHTIIMNWEVSFMSYSADICNRIVHFLDTDDWKYSLDREKEIIKSGLSINSKMKHVDIVFDLRDDKYLVYFTYPLNCDEDERGEMRDLLNRINYGIMFGCLEMDDRDGEIRFRYPVDCDGQLPSQQIIRHSIYRPAATLNKYGDAIVAVLMGFATGKEAYDKANK